jgi:hypothetical protein
MMSQKSGIQLDDGRVAAIAGAGFLLAYTLGKAWLQETKAMPEWILLVGLDLTRDLGIAAIVAAVVSLGIEKISRRELKEEIGNERLDFQQRISSIEADIRADREAFRHLTESGIKGIQHSMFNAVFSKNLPVVYGEALKELIVSAKWFRRETHVIVDIIDPATEVRNSLGERLVEYYSTMSSISVNVTDADQTLDQRVFIDRDIDGRESEILTWKIGDKTLTPEEIKAARVPDDSPFVTWYRFPDAPTLRPGDSAHIYLKTKRYRHRRDCTTWCSITPADGIRFELNHPPNFRVVLDAKTPALASDLPQSSDGQRIALEIFKPLLPYFTVELEWYPDHGSVPSSASTTGAGLN